jgi:hypothetical protein
LRQIAALASPALAGEPPTLVGNPIFVETISPEPNSDELLVVFRVDRALVGPTSKPQGSVSLDDYVRPVKQTGASSKHCYTATLTSGSAHRFKLGRSYRLTFIFGRGSTASAETRSLKVLAPPLQFPTCP